MDLVFCFVKFAFKFRDWKENMAPESPTQGGALSQGAKFSGKFVTVVFSKGAMASLLKAFLLMVGMTAVLDGMGGRLHLSARQEGTDEPRQLPPRRPRHHTGHFKSPSSQRGVRTCLGCLHFRPREAAPGAVGSHRQVGSSHSRRSCYSDRTQ